MPGVLSRDELAVLLEALAEGRRESDQAARLLQVGSQRQGASRSLAVRFRPGFEQFCVGQGQRWSSRYQTRVLLNVLDISEVDIPSLAELLPEKDGALFISSGLSPQPGAILLSRSFYFSWLSLVFGSRPGAPLPLVPTRPYTVIEQRFLCRFGEELLDELAGCVPELLGKEAAVLGIEDARAFAAQSGSRALLVNIEVRGVGELGRIRLALPLPGAGVLDDREEPPPGLGPPLLDTVLDTPVAVKAELGSTSLPLSRLAGLRVGDVIPIDGAEGGKLTILVEGTHKFEAARGRMGERQAVRIVERVKPRKGEGP